jgi:pimeloyl-ACP methyl ester carboxylesterase
LARKAIVCALAVLVVLVIGLSVAGCVLGSMTTPGDEKGLMRSTRDAELDDGRRLVVSALASAPEAVTGSGPKLVYVHGTPGDATGWGAYLRRPVEGLPSIAIDRPGFGASSHDQAYTSYADQAAAVLSMVGEGNARTILIGHSLGGPIVAWAASEAPDKICAVVILAGSLDPEHEDPRWYNYALAIPGVSWFFERPLVHSNSEMFAGRAQTSALSKRLANITCPVVLVHGMDDPLVPFENTRYASSALTSARVVEVVALPDTNHFIVWNREDAVREAIARAIALSGNADEDSREDRESGEGTDTR